MDTESIIKALDAEIAKLKNVRALLADSGKLTIPQSAVVPQPVKRRKMSKASRAAIAEAQRKRWAAARKTTK